MREGKYIVNTIEYEVELPKLMRRRLKQFGAEWIMNGADCGRDFVAVRIEDEVSLELWVKAVCEILSKDIAHFEIARLINFIPISLEEKQLALPEAVRSARGIDMSAEMKAGIMKHYADYEHLNLEGFLRFRMQKLLGGWAVCVEEAAENVMFREKYLELMDVLSEYVRPRLCSVQEVVVIIHPDGSCTLTDDSNARIDCAASSEDGVISLLIGLAPAKITVYDLSLGRNSLLAEAIGRVFEDRVKLFY